MGLFSRRQPAEQMPVCLRCHILDVPANPVQWRLLPGCDHVGGWAAVCDPCKQQIEVGNRVPGTFECPCGATAPVLTPIRE